MWNSHLAYFEILSSTLGRHFWIIEKSKLWKTVKVKKNEGRSLTGGPTPSPLTREWTPVHRAIRGLCGGCEPLNGSLWGLLSIAPTTLETWWPLPLRWDFTWPKTFLGIWWSAWVGGERPLRWPFTRPRLTEDPSPLRTPHSPKPSQVTKPS